MFLNTSNTFLFMKLNGFEKRHAIDVLCISIVIICYTCAPFVKHYYICILFSHAIMHVDVTKKKNQAKNAFSSEALQITEITKEVQMNVSLAQPLCCSVYITIVKLRLFDTNSEKIVALYVHFAFRATDCLETQTNKANI